VVERVVRPAPVVEERVVAPAVDPNVILLRLEDAIDALRTWLVIVGVVAVAALAVAVWAVTHDDTSGGGSRSGLASDERVTQIENRVDRLSRQVQALRANTGSGGDTSALASRIDNLESQIKSLSSGGSSAAGGTQQAIDELSKRIDSLATDVESLKSSQTTTP
jgi:polyhydroxyalkanoate synthesis regulator phasin